MAIISNGTTMLSSGAFNVNLGSMVLLSEQTASASASISFTTGIDSTYPIYKFEFINIHPSSDNSFFQFNLSTDSGSNYNVTKTTTFFKTQHSENDVYASVDYITDSDLAQSTAFQQLSTNSGNGADESCAGTMTLFNPASTVYVKHFISNTNLYHFED